MSLYRHVIRVSSVSPICGRHGQSIQTTFSGVPQRHASFLKIQKEDSYAIINMCKAPVNNQSKAFILQMKDAILDLESDKDVQGLIITSACPKVFSAGLDLEELYQKPFESLFDLWRAMQETWLVHYGSRLATIAAINGHCLGVGAITALTCDYRIMARRPYTMGLNESRRFFNVLFLDRYWDLVLAFWMWGLLKNTVGHRQTERAFQLGLSFSPEDALRAGLVDELVDEKDLLDRAREEMATWLEISSPTRHRCKMEMRGPLMEELREKQEEDCLEIARQFQSEGLQRNLERFFQSKRK